MNSNSDSINKIIADMILCDWVIRKSVAESNFSIAGWSLSVQPEIMDDTKRRMNGEQLNKIEMAVRKIYTDR